MFYIFKGFRLSLRAWDGPAWSSAKHVLLAAYKNTPASGKLITPRRQTILQLSLCQLKNPYQLDYFSQAALATNQ